ncbi:NUDIX hydrolase [Peptococcus simiae]|uniref:NUDIX hydrolase n=1 Tax=Peptococcus simiae TaxID=1643805 RepID=A0ABW9GW83_9FIRM
MEPFLDALTTGLLKYDPQPLGKRHAFAVLLPLVRMEDEWYVLYEVRSARISQPGETSFPGGAIEPGECPSDAAVREAMEELCLERTDIRLLGEMDFIVTETAIIYCFVGFIDGKTPADIQPNEDEVEEVYALPLAWLCENPPKYYETKIQASYSDDFPTSRLPGGSNYQWKRRNQIVAFYDIPDSGYNLWGLTARLTDRFIDFLSEEDLYHCISCIQ